MFLNDSGAVAGILSTLLAGNDEQVLIAYQLAFDLQDRATQAFLSEIRNLLPQPSGTKTSAMEEVDEDQSTKQSTQIPTERISQIHAILNGQTTIALQVDFLYRHNHTDTSVLKNIKVFIVVQTELS